MRGWIAIEVNEIFDDPIITWDNDTKESALLAASASVDDLIVQGIHTLGEIEEAEILLVEVKGTYKVKPTTSVRMELQR